MSCIYSFGLEPCTARVAGGFGNRPRGARWRWRVLDEQNTLQTTASPPVSRHTMDNLFRMAVENVTTRTVAVEPPRHGRLAVSYDY